MAKALIGYMGVSDPRNEARLVSETRRLRQRVVDLEAVVMRLQAENDRLVASADHETLLTVPEQLQHA